MSQTKKQATDPEAPARPPMDLKHIKNLIDLMVENDLSRMELREGDTHILLRRGQPVVASMSGTMPPPLLPGTHATAGNPGQPAAPAVAAEDELLIRSPMVGTFYAATEPEAPPLVGIGAHVSPDTVVCLIEAMKVFNEIKAETSGVVSRILVKNAQAVEFDQPLFALRPA
jgi:acetyl-CoA carboxylase biotin carboxyl carrier protein